MCSLALASFVNNLRRQTRGKSGRAAIVSRRSSQKHPALRSGSSSTITTVAATTNASYIGNSSKENEINWQEPTRIPFRSLVQFLVTRNVVHGPVLWESHKSNCYTFLKRVTSFSHALKFGSRRVRAHTHIPQFYAVEKCGESGTSVRATNTHTHRTKISIVVISFQLDFFPRLLLLLLSTFFFLPLNWIKQ